MALISKLSFSVHQRCSISSNLSKNHSFSHTRDSSRRITLQPSSFLSNSILHSSFTHSKRPIKNVTAHASFPSDKNPPSEDENNEEEPAMDSSLPDWREFRARLIQGYSNQPSFPPTQDIPPSSPPSAEPSSLSDHSDSINQTIESEASISSEFYPSDRRHSELDGANSTVSSTATSSATWAHPLVIPEPGCLVIAHPGAFGARQQYFHQAVIFLYAHGDSGSAGVILDRPTEYTLGQLAGSENLLPEFANCPLYMGGDVGENFTHVVHGVRNLPGSREIVSGVFVGGYSAIKEHVRSGKSKDTDYKWFARYAGWAPGQLEREVAAGVWFLGSCSKDLILEPCVNLEKPLWRRVMELMGGEHAALSKRVYGGI